MKHWARLLRDAQTGRLMQRTSQPRKQATIQWITRQELHSTPMLLATSRFAEQD